MVFSKQICMLIYVHQNDGEKKNMQDILIPTPRQLNFQFFSIQDILKCEHSLRTKKYSKRNPCTVIVSCLISLELSNF